MSRLQLLARQISKAKATPGAETVPNSVLKMIMEGAEAEAAKAIAVMQKKLDSAEVEIASLRATMEKMKQSHTSMLKAAQDGAVAAKASARKDMDAVCASHKDEIQRLRSKLEAAQAALATEGKEKAAAEASCKAMERTCQALEQQLSKASQAVQTQPPQVILPPAAPMKPLTMKVAQRDSEGRIASITIVPST